MPHGVASDKKIENGDAVTIDFGCIYKHYCSDMTRTFFVGQPDAELERIYHIVYEAQIAAMEGYRFGMTGAELDGISREIIAGKGYGSNFGHSLGHGVGIEIHEGAAISRRNTEAIRKDTVFSRTGNLCRGPRRRADRGSCRCGRKRSSDPHGRF